MKKTLLIALMMFNVLAFQADDVSAGISERELCGYDSKPLIHEDHRLAGIISAMLDERNDLSEDQRSVLSLAETFLVCKPKSYYAVSYYAVHFNNDDIDHDKNLTLANNILAIIHEKKDDLKDDQILALNRAAKYLLETIVESK